MVITRKFQTVKELQALQQLACSVPDEVWVRAGERGETVDAKSIINLFTLDYSRPVEIVTDAEELAELLASWDAPYAALA